jgi:exopolysaccharide biosynthesis polyprenyl glycosylphosphotransferase
VLVFYIIYHIRLITDLIPGIQLKIPPINYNETMIYSLLASIVFVGIGIIQRLYELHKPIQRYFQTFSKVWMYWLIIITFIAYFGQGFLFLFGISRFIIFVSAVAVYFALFFFDQFWNWLEAKAHKKSDDKIIIIGSDTLESYKAIEQIKSWFPFKTEFVRINEVNEIDFEEYVMVVAVGRFEKQVLQDLFEKTRFSYARFYHISEWFFLEDVVYAPETINSIIALEYKNSTLDGWSLIWKRVFDVIGSLCLIVIFSRVMIIISLLLKITSPGPIIFHQKRVGKWGTLFTFLKFRSMYAHLSTGEEYGGTQADKLYKKLIKTSNIRDAILHKIENDPRITPLGKFLRKTSLDELPQLFCVFIGTMSLVGPRPHLPDEVNLYEHRQKRLLSVKPGITGYAQMFWRDNLDFEEEAKLDLFYIQNWTTFLDLYIIFATLGVVFKWK